MEHIVEFAISFDDKTITKHIETNLYNDIFNVFVNKADAVFEGACKKPYYGASSTMDDLMKECVLKILEDNQEKLIELAAESLATKFSRTKVFKEKMADKVFNEEE